MFLSCLTQPSVSKISRRQLLLSVPLPPHLGTCSLQWSSSAELFSLTSTSMCSSHLQHPSSFKQSSTPSLNIVHGEADPPPRSSCIVADEYKNAISLCYDEAFSILILDSNVSSANLYSELYGFGSRSSCLCSR